MKSTQRFANPRRERGVVLVIGLLLLLVVTLLGLAAMSSTTMQEKMAGNQRDREVAFEAAEAALRDAERDIELSGRISGASGFASGCASTLSDRGLCAPSTTLTPVWQAVDWSDNASPVRYVLYGEQTGAPAWPNVVRQPRYIIEVLPNLRGNELNAGSYSEPAGPRFQYRVTATGYGLTATSQVQLQSVYRMP